MSDGRWFTTIVAVALAASCLMSLTEPRGNRMRRWLITMVTVLGGAIFGRLL